MHDLMTTRDEVSAAIAMAEEHHQHQHQHHPLKQLASVSLDDMMQQKGEGGLLQQLNANYSYDVVPEEENYDIAVGQHAKFSYMEEEHIRWSLLQHGVTKAGAANKKGGAFERLAS